MSSNDLIKPTSVLLPECSTIVVVGYLFFGRVVAIAAMRSVLNAVSDWPRACEGQDVAPGTAKRRLFTLSSRTFSTAGRAGGAQRRLSTVRVQAESAHAARLHLALVCARSAYGILPARDLSPSGESVLCAVICAADAPRALASLALFFQYVAVMPCDALAQVFRERQVDNLC